jgi:hypothetical protein
MTSLIKKALASMENMEVKVEVTSTSDIKSTQQAIQVPTSSVDKPTETTIALDGPLSTIYFKALNIAYAKVDPVTGTPATESLAIADYYRAAEIKKKTTEGATPTEAESNTTLNYSGTVLRAPMKEETIPVVQDIVRTGMPVDFCIVYDTMAPTAHSPMGVSNDIQSVIVDSVEPIALEDIESFSIVVKMKSKKI